MTNDKEVKKAEKNIRLSVEQKLELLKKDRLDNDKEVKKAEKNIRLSVEQKLELLKKDRLVFLNDWNALRKKNDEFIRKLHQDQRNAEEHQANLLNIHNKKDEVGSANNNTINNTNNNVQNQNKIGFQTIQEHPEENNPTQSNGDNQEKKNELKNESYFDLSEDSRMDNKKMKV
eukprot:CAMPEP_0116947802 /NCGR_PEP_ID=MMETSP0467-20121206/37908_1 /TAXON_ID=283647 /ORGANISM="Mesodinium pulex, Strain SPMC105" /LENGTH=173 /DNA_ID=CAMNT_0004632061 /DNA_START=837 /DNA_END=1359 /DNA_ORIENTATION=-